VLASIPSPSRGVIDIGPIPLHAYGLCLAVGVIAAAAIGNRRYLQRGGDEGTISDIAVVVVVSGIIGARVYHLFTGYKWDEDGIVGTLKIWEGGLSIWGAVAGGAIGLAWIARRRNLPALAIADAIAPGVLIGQAIGRWGNWFNQELFGRPTKLPWGLEIDPSKRPEGYEGYATFHPTFLYESLYCVAMFFVIVAVERRMRARWRAGQTTALYVALYTFGRFWFELMRTDPAPRIIGVRVNVFVSAALCVLAVVAFVIAARRGRPAFSGAPPNDNALDVAATAPDPS
jgi:prolipoprotein diacylglyceryl transferase